MLVLGLLGAEKYRNLQINCISLMLTSPSILLTISPTPICQQFAPNVAYFPGAASFSKSTSFLLFSSASVKFMTPPAAGACARPLVKSYVRD